MVDVLGRGGMGDVWRVWDQRERAFRAAKLQRQSDSASLLRFVRESSTRVDHPHVLAPTGWWADDGRVLIVMPLVDGGSVAVLLADHGALGDRWARTLGLQLLDALTAVHAAGLVHRDVKPSNLLLSATGTAAPELWLSDFGIAVRADEPRLTHHSEVVHTPGYSAPEVLGGADPDPRQDLYSCGVVLVELLTGRRPGADGDGPVPSGPFAELVTGLLAADPADRYGSAAEAREALEAVPVPAPSGEPIEVFDQLPPWPPGWGPGGPVPVAPPPSSSPVAAPRSEPVTPQLSVPARRVGPLPTGRGPEPQPEAEPEPESEPAPSSAPAPGPSATRRAPWPAVALAVLGVGLLVAAVVTALA
nr:serine/threonine-protein kinase [Jiangella mangrovi]